MAELEIRLDVDRVTRKKNITISYRSDEDALPMEHEEEHRRLVDALIEQGVLKAEEVGEVTIEREQQVGSFEPEQQERGETEKRSVDQEQ